MRIWVIGRGYPSTVNHMLGSFELEQAQMFAKYGNEVYYPVVDLRSVRHRRKWGLSLAQQQGVTIATFSFPVGRIVPMKWQILLKRHFREVLLRKLGRRTGKPDIIHVHYPSIYPYKLFSGFQKEGAKIIGTEQKVENAFVLSAKELSMLHGNDSMIVKEIKSMVSQIKINKPIDVVFKKFAMKTHIEDIIDFSEVFIISKLHGGNISKIIGNTINVINDKIEVKIEIDTVTASKRYEQKLMNLLPFLIIIYMNISSASFLRPLYITVTGRLLMTFALVVYYFSVKISKKILEIEV